MKNLWQKLLTDETGVVLSSEIALVGTVGVLSMVVGLNAVACAVTSELNDLASAFGAIDQTFNYQSISKVGHGRVTGSGYNDARDMCDCQLISQAEVSGRSNGGGSSQGGGGGSSQGQGINSQSFGRQNTFSDSAPAARERLVGEERVIDEVSVAPPAAKAAAADVVCEEEDDIIEERIIIRRVKADCDCANATKSVPSSKATKAKVTKPKPSQPTDTDPIEVKPQSKKPR